MANTVFRVKRSSVAGKVPNTSTLSVGEMGLNLTDKILYSSDGTDVFEIGSNNTIIHVTNNIFIGNSSVNTFANSTTLTVNNSTISNLVVSSITANNSKGSFGQVLTTNGTGIYWATSTGGSGSGLQDVRQQYVGDGTTTTYSVNGGYQANSLSVYLNGVLLRNGTDVDVTGGLDFILTTPPSNGALIDVVGISTYYSNGTATVVSQQFTANGTANSFNISGGYIANNIQVFLNGVKQINGTDVITTSGSTINFIDTPANGYIVDVFGYQQDVLVVGGTYTYGNSTVNTSITAGSITINGYSVATNTDLTANLANYLPLGGGNLIGDLYHNYGTYNIFLDTANNVGSTSVQMVMEAGNNFTTFYGNSSAIYLRPTGTFGIGNYYGLNRFIVSANGNVGIGNTDPTDKLSVNGTTYLGGDTTISGNLIVSGTTVTVNTTTLDVKDLNITVAKGAASAAAANGAGLTVDGANANWVYNNVGNTWQSNVNISTSNSIAQTNITPTSIFLGNSSVNCVINSTSVYVNGVDYNPTTALAIAVALS